MIIILVTFLFLVIVVSLAYSKSEYVSSKSRTFLYKPLITAECEGGTLECRALCAPPRCIGASASTCRIQCPTGGNLEDCPTCEIICDPPPEGDDPPLCESTNCQYSCVLKGSTADISSCGVSCLVTGEDPTLVEAIPVDL